MPTMLTDFTKSELQTLLESVVYRIVEEDLHKRAWCDKFGEDKDGVPWEPEMYYDEKIRPIRGVNYEHLCLWRTQILNAIGKVGIKEAIEMS